MPSATDEHIFLESAAAKRKIRVIALEGAHGVGKTSLAQVLELLGFHVLREDFMDVFSNFFIPGNAQHNCLVEIAWASMQITNIVNMANNIRRELIMNPTAFDTFVVDRCFLTGYVYGQMTDETRKWYLTLFTDAVKDLQEHYNIEFSFIRMRPIDSASHYERILKRLNNDETGIRKELNEADADHLINVNKGYDALQDQGIIEREYLFDYIDVGIGYIAIPIGRFFDAAGMPALAERYKDLHLIYNPNENCLMGLYNADSAQPVKVYGKDDDEEIYEEEEENKKE